jgi:hypothetical protein
MGFDPTPIVLARLGLSREVSETLKLWPGRWQFYCNGFGHYGPRDIARADAALRFRTNLVQDASLPEQERESRKFPFATWPFRHTGMESMSVLACAMNESLLQSHDGIIRVAPAAAKDQHARFTLHAQDGFVVSAEIKEGKPFWISIKSRLGKTCRMASPWPRALVYANGKPIGRLEQSIVEFPTSENALYVIAPDEETMENWQASSVQYQENETAKSHPSGCASLGLPRMF